LEVPIFGLAKCSSTLSCSEAEGVQPSNSVLLLQWIFQACASVASTAFINHETDSSSTKHHAETVMDDDKKL
jgi:hypothetical protein